MNIIKIILQQSIIPVYTSNLQLSTSGVNALFPPVYLAYRFSSQTQERKR